MLLLLDTHSFLWFAQDDPQLSLGARLLLSDPNNQRILSVVSIWEMAIKISRGKLSLPRSLEVFIPEQLEINRIDVLTIEPAHAIQVHNLPFHNHPESGQEHKDPFDRLIIVQSLLTGIPIVGRDVVFDLYGVKRLW